MSKSPAEVPREGAPVLVSIPEMPPRLADAGLRVLGTARLRQLAKTPGFPAPVYTRGRVRLWLWSEVEGYFRGRKLTPGRRTDLERDAEGGA